MPDLKFDNRNKNNYEFIWHYFLFKINLNKWEK